jgi:[ribosomal protein S18]-alanine N-acetyltransferase
VTPWRSPGDTPLPAAASTIRPVGPEAASLLAALHATAFPPAESWGADAIALILGLPGAFARCAVAPGGEAPQGFVLARVAADEAEILTLAVPPAVRRCGVGAALLRAAAAGAAARGATALFLEVSAANAPARALYAAAGFAEVGRRRRYYADGADALVLRLSPLS